MKNLPIFYSPLMLGQTQSFSPSAFKPKFVMEDWEKKFSQFIQTHDVTPLIKDDLYLAHDKFYVDRIFDGTTKNGFGVKDTNFANTFLYTNGSFFSSCFTCS